MRLSGTQRQVWRLRAPSVRFGPRQGGRTVVIAAAVVAVTVGPVLGLTVAYAYAGDVPRGTTVLGIDVGGRSQAEAETALQAGLDRHAEALAAPVAVQVGESDLQLDPAEVGLAVDVPATVDRAASVGIGPVSALFGSRTVEPVVRVDAETLDGLLQEAAGDAGETMTMPEIRFEGTEPAPVYPEPGLGLDPQTSAAALTSAWPAIGETGSWREATAIAVPLVEIHPVTTAEQVDRLVAELAAPAVAAPVEITVPDAGTIEASPRAIAKSLKLTADERGEIIPRVDKRDLRRALGEQLSQVETEPVDATVELAGGGPSVVAAQNGIRVDMERLAADLLPVLPGAAPRAVQAATVAAEPEVSTEQAEGLRITERVSTFTTDFEGGLSVPRNHNIALTADMVDGAVVLPGEVFSLNGHTGERGYSQGFLDAPVILGGRLTPAVGGGISQFTTTLFNAAYYAGLEDVEHHPHQYYYSRYPSVIESTIFYPDLDMQFRNNADYGVLVDTSYDEGSITVSMWSTKVWDEVTTEWGPRRDVVRPQRQYLDPGPDCIATVGIEGFTQDAWRVFIRDGQEVQREQFSWSYDAQPEFICGERPDRE